MTGTREMTLKEWCAKLPDCHLVNRELQQLEQDNEDLQHDIARQIAISSELATENKEMLEALKAFNEYGFNGPVADALIAKIESQKEGG